MTLWPELAFEWSHWTKPSRRSGTQAKKDGDTVAAAGAWINYKNYFGKQE